MPLRHTRVCYGVMYTIGALCGILFFWFNIYAAVKGPSSKDSFTCSNNCFNSTHNYPNCTTALVQTDICVKYYHHCCHSLQNQCLEWSNYTLCHYTKEQDWGGFTAYLLVINVLVMSTTLLTTIIGLTLMVLTGQLNTNDGYLEID